MRRTIMILLVLFFSVGLFAGGSSEKKAEKYTIRVAIVSSDSHLHNQILNQWAEKAAEDTNGRLEIRVLGSGQLGGERDYIEGMQLGSIEMAQVSSGPVESFVPDFAVLSLPYFFENYEQMEEILNGPIGEKLFDELEEKGIIGLTWFTNGFRNVYTTDTAVYTPEDLHGQKIRVMESSVMISTLNAMGASATPMAYGELYAAIQQGVLDGAENALGNIYSDKYYEICKNVSLTEHFAPPGVVAISKSSFNKLPSDLQDYLLSSAKEFGKLEREQDEILQEEMKQLLEEEGMEVNEVDKESFIQATSGVYASLKNTVSPEMQQLVTDVTGKVF